MRNRREIPSELFPGGGLITAWFIFVGIAALAMLGCIGWAIFKLVTWVVAQ